MRVDYSIRSDRPVEGTVFGRPTLGWCDIRSRSIEHRPSRILSLGETVAAGLAADP